MLENNRLATRELAIFNLERLFGDAKGYFASDESTRQTRAIGRWRDLLKENGGRLIKQGANPGSN